MRSSPNYAPDGMASIGDTLGRHRPGTVRQQDWYDDGLVHNHNWAVTTNIGVMMGVAGRSFAGSVPSTSVDLRPRRSVDDTYDDGLVHNHDWARTTDR